MRRTFSSCSTGCTRDRTVGSSSVSCKRTTKPIQAVGAEIVALSADTPEQARLTVSELGITYSIPFGLIAYTHPSL